MPRPSGSWSGSPIPAAKERVKAYPHQFSGGMRQRIMIAMAIALDPAVLIADEPTTALDVTVQAQIMALLAELQEERQMGLILITHDLGVVADVADRIAVMYAGRIVERAGIEDLYAHPPTPTPGGCSSRSRDWTRRARRWRPSVACRRTSPASRRAAPFNPRCRMAQDICRTDRARPARGRPGASSPPATSPRRSSMADVILKADDLVQALPDQGWSPAHDHRPGQGRRRRLLRAAHAARRSASSASRAVASPRWAACSCVSRSPPRAR